MFDEDRDQDRKKYSKCFYYIAINIERFKLWDKSRVTSVQISLDIGTLTQVKSSQMFILDL